MNIYVTKAINILVQLAFASDNIFRDYGICEMHKSKASGGKYV